MPIYIDESGDTGAIAKKGSRYFRVASVWVPNKECAERITAAIESVKSSLKLKPTFEFKASRTSRRNGDEVLALFRELAQHQLLFSVGCVDKSHHELLAAKPWQILKIAVEESLRPLRPTVDGEPGHGILSFGRRETITVDDNCDEKFRLAIQTTFRQNTGLLCSPKFKASHREPLLQVADMICGIVARAENGDEFAEQLYRKVAKFDLRRGE